VVFSIRFPLRRELQQLDMSRWFQNIMAIMQVKKLYDSDYEPFPGWPSTQIMQQSHE
jgi:hypothetical protein